MFIKVFLVQLEILGLQEFEEFKAEIAFQDLLEIKEIEGVRCHTQTHTFT